MKTTDVMADEIADYVRKALKERGFVTELSVYNESNLIVRVMDNGCPEAYVNASLVLPRSGSGVHKDGQIYRLCSYIFRAGWQGDRFEVETAQQHLAQIQAVVEVAAECKELFSGTCLLWMDSEEGASRKAAERDAWKNERRVSEVFGAKDVKGMRVGTDRPCMMSCEVPDGLYLTSTDKKRYEVEVTNGYAIRVKRVV